METEKAKAERTIHAVTGLPRPGLALWSLANAAFVMGIGLLFPFVFLVAARKPSSGPPEVGGIVLTLGLCSLFVVFGVFMLRRPAMLSSTEEIELTGRQLRLILTRAGKQRVEEVEVSPTAVAIRNKRGAWEQSLAGEDGEVSETVICLVSTTGKRVYFGGRMDSLERLRLSDRINEHLMALRESE